MFTYDTVIRLHDTDAAQRLFFASLFRIAHEAYEAWLADAGMPIARMLAKQDTLLPIAHASADFKAPLRVGDRIRVTIEPTRVGASSFTLGYRFTAGRKTVAVLTTVHVAVDRRGKPRAIPPRLKAALRAA